MEESSISKMLQQFEWKRLLRVCGGAHHGKIGEWIRWWIDLKPRHMVINPAPMESTKRVFADILFLEEVRGTNLFEVVGVAEVEDDKEKWIDKLQSLKAYGQNQKQFPDLKFALLCMSVYMNITIEKDIWELGKAVQNLSKNSRMDWILYMLKYAKISKEETPWAIKITDYAKGSDSFFYTHRNLVGVEWIIIRNGESLKEHSEDITPS